VVIVALTDASDVLLVQQYRYATGQYLVELPAGLIDPGEGAIEAAGRELYEETGYRASSLRQLADVFVSPGYSTERTKIVLAENCAPVAHEADEDEPMDIIHCPLTEVPSLLTVDSPVILNMQAMLGLMWLYRLGYCSPTGLS
jgi:8-oxo-dGTP pyrophosphatase MutT (NUDIX family)